MAGSAGSRAGDPELSARLRRLPSVEELASGLDGVPHALAVAAAREAIDARREELLADGAREEEPVRSAPLRRHGPAPAARVAGSDVDRVELIEAARRLIAERERPVLREVLNATGVIVHTNLGRAPLAAAATAGVAGAASGYSNLEYDLERGERGSRHAHVEGLLCELTGAEAAAVVNNCAAAVLLAAAALAGGRELVVSRGQLVEIGGSFRIPEVVAQSGARLVEVGTTNRTRLADYERALGSATGALLRAHQSNFRTVGFVEEVAIEELCGAAGAAGVPVIDDAGSGALADGVPELAGEPDVRRSVRAGCAVVCFSGDKLLGGPQAGVMVGTGAAIDLCRAHPLARAVRIDKLSLSALEATLRLYRDPAAARRAIPVLAMLTAGEEELAARAERMRSLLAAAGAAVSVVRASARVGGGALPLLELEGPVCAVEPGPEGLDELARRLRVGAPAVVGRASEGWLLLDPRTLDDDGAERAARAIAGALAGA